MIIHNAMFTPNYFKRDDIYVFAIGYEHRSYYLYDKIRSLIPEIKPIFFVLNDFSKYPHTLNKVKEIKKCNGKIYDSNYIDSRIVQQTIMDIVCEQTTKKESVTIHIDYSSMPRSWYCKLPTLLEKIIRQEDKIYFWYSEGSYPPSYEEYPSAGIDSFSLFSGKPSLKIDNERVHVLGLGYDIIRSQAILSITDPNFLVSCCAYNPKQKILLDNLKTINNPILSRSAMTLALHIDDFEFMVYKLCDTANELLPFGDVILIPDGTKPLIFAFSLVPDLLNKNGLTCLHITRNNKYFEAVDVGATENVYGFSINVSEPITNRL